MSLSRRAFLAALSAASLSRSSPSAALATPLELYPDLERRLRDRADLTARQLTAAGLDLAPSDGAFAPALDVAAVTRVAGRRLMVPADGLLAFAVDAPRATWVSGQLELLPPDDARPGLRTTVLCDTTVVGAPMSSAAPWGVGEITDAAPHVIGTGPPQRIALAPWLMQQGRHYITVAGPHWRPAGAFVSLRLQALDRTVDAPLYRFAFVTDTHVRRTGREAWMNQKLCDASAPELHRTLTALAREDIAFVVHGGDLTDRATRDEFLLIREILAAQPMRVYASLGNHDRYLPASRLDALELLAPHFPEGALDYVFVRPPLRFVVMDVAIEDDSVRARKLQWLEETLAADRTTPTVFVWHYPPYNRGGAASCGFRLQDWSELGRSTVLDLLQRAPNVVAAINGHDHWDEVNAIGGLTVIQNAAFVEWPNTYRIYSVYRDRIEWEVRQAANRGFVRESFLPEKAMSWMIATRDGDLRGVVPTVRPVTVRRA